MGRGTVAGGGAAGLYSLALDVGKAERDAAVAKMDARLAELTPKIAELQAALEAAEAARDEARGLAQAAISAYADAMRADPEGDHQALADEVQARIEVAVQLEGEAAKVRIPLEDAQAEKAQLEKDRLAQLAVPVERTVSAWCVDLTENASGQVATLEVPGEPGRVLIAPGGRAPADADGRLLARGVMSPAQAFWNAAVLPGWQKWMPDYRTGTITALDQNANLADVALDDLTSTAQGLKVNQTNTVTNVPVVYMTCNAQAFEVGDRVVVAFDGRAWANPRVIGFVESPKACFSRGWSISGGLFGQRANGEYEWRPSFGGAGNLSWTGGGQTCSWLGPVGKHVGQAQGSNEVYYQGKAYVFPLRVRGAAVYRVDGGLFIYAACDRFADLGSPLNEHRMYRMPVAGGAPQLLWSAPYLADEQGTLGVNSYVGITGQWQPVSFHPTEIKAVGATVSMVLGAPGQAFPGARYIVHMDATGIVSREPASLTTLTSVYEFAAIEYLPGLNTYKGIATRTITGTSLPVAAEYNQAGDLVVATYEFDFRSVQGPGLVVNDDVWLCLNGERVLRVRHNTAGLEPRDFSTVFALDLISLRRVAFQKTSISLVKINAGNATASYFHELNLGVNSDYTIGEFNGPPENVGGQFEDDSYPYDSSGSYTVTSSYAGGGEFFAAVSGAGGQYAWAAADVKLAMGSGDSFVISHRTPVFGVNSWPFVFANPWMRLVASDFSENDFYLKSGKVPPYGQIGFVG